MHHETDMNDVLVPEGIALLMSLVILPPMTCLAHVEMNMRCEYAGILPQGWAKTGEGGALNSIY